MNVELGYALNQLRPIVSDKDVGLRPGAVADRVQRAIDALERLEEELELAPPVGPYCTAHEGPNGRPCPIHTDGSCMQPPIAAGVVCNCPSDFCPAHGKVCKSEAKAGRKVRG